MYVSGPSAANVTQHVLDGGVLTVDHVISHQPVARAYEKTVVAYQQPLGGLAGDMCLAIPATVPLLELGPTEPPVYHRNSSSPSEYARDSGPGVRL